MQFRSLMNDIHEEMLTILEYEILLNFSPVYFRKNFMHTPQYTYIYVHIYTHMYTNIYMQYVYKYKWIYSCVQTYSPNTQTYTSQALYKQCIQL